MTLFILNYFVIRLLIFKMLSKMVALPKISLEKYIIYWDLLTCR